MITSLSKEETLYVLSTNYIGRIAYVDQNIPYIVPVTYFYDRVNNYIISYSGHGHKLGAMRKNPDVCLECEDLEHVKSWKTVVAHGKFKELSGSQSKQLLHTFTEGVKKIMAAKGRDAAVISDFSSALSENKLPEVYVINLESVSGRKQ